MAGATLRGALLTLCVDWTLFVGAAYLDELGAVGGVARGPRVGTGVFLMLFIPFEIELTAF